MTNIHRQGYFSEMQQVLFSEQPSFGIKSWRDFASLAGVPDLSAFDACVQLTADSFPRITYGRELGARNGVRATPTIWINGEIQPIPTLEALRAAIERQMVALR